MKKIIALLLVIALTAALSVSLTMAYLQDTDDDVNVMTLGNVYIDQHEQQRVNDTDKQHELESYQDKAIYPAVYEGSSIPWAPEADWVKASDQAWKVVADNECVIDKFVTVENTGASEAFVRTIFAIEVGADKVNDPYMHIVTNGTNITSGATWTWKWVQDKAIKIGDNYYVLAVATYTEPLAPKATTIPSLKQVYLDKTATNEVVAKYGPTFEILAFSQAVQTAGFSSAEEALETAFYEVTAENHPWNNEGTGTIPEIVTTADELSAALADGGMVVLADDVVLNDQPIDIKKDTTLNLNGNTLSGTSTSDTTSKLINVAAGSSLTITNGTVSFYATKPDTTWGGDGQPPFPGYANNTISCSGKLIIDGATIENKTAPGGASYAIDCYPGADLVINSGTINGHGKVAIRMFANSDKVATSVTINGGTITGSRAVWIQLPGSNINSVKLANLTVNGGTLTTTVPEKQPAIYSYSYGDSREGTYVTITGGTFNGNVAFGGGQDKESTTKEHVTITGGTFNGELGRHLANDGWEHIAKP